MVLPRARRGYILLMTLLLIAIAGIALASIERLSLTRAIEATRAEEDLRRRWLWTTTQTTLLAQASQIMEDAQADAGQPVVQHLVPLTVGSCQMELTFTDEQAKPNLNTLWNTRSPEQCQETLQHLLESTGGGVPFVLQPTPKDLSTLYGEATFGRYGQVFPHPEPAVLLGGPGATAGPAAALTLWGSGQLNFHRATPVSLREVCAPILGPADVEKLLSIRQNQPALGTVKLLTLLGVTKEQRTALLGRLTERSNCFGLWMVLQDADGKRYRFAVTNGGAMQIDGW